MRTVLLLALLAMLAIPVDASNCVPSRSDPEVDTDPLGTGAGPRYYVDNDPSICCLVTLWVYEESNDIDGLQRDDDVRDDTCRGTIAPDTLVY